VDSKPLCEEIALPAPLPDVFAAFLAWPDPVFLDSSLVHTHLGRYSYVAADPFLTLSSKDGQVTVRGRGSAAHAWLAASEAGDVAAPSGSEGAARPRGKPLSPIAGDPFGELQRILRAHPAERVPGLPPFQGGAVGYFAYDLGRHLEVLPRTAVDDVGLPDLRVGLYGWTLAHDHLRGRTWLIASPLDGGRPAARARLRELRRLIESVRPVERAARPRLSGPRHEPSCNFTRDAYLRAVAAAKAYIAEGDIYQVCLSQRFAVGLDYHPWQLYRRLRAVSPVPYGAYLGFPEAAIASASPELFLRLERGQVETRPIKGTRPRGTTPELDAGLAEELRLSEKDRAENLMIVDLLRNDLGRACRIGSVRVPELFGLETYSTVHHLVSTVRGGLRPGLDAVDLLRACFPGGSVTGCPKIRAMGIIDELEPTCRGVYCGAIGFLGFDGDMDTSIVIRTVVVKDGRAYYQVGGAVVADSDPAAEYQETLDKAQAAILALGGADMEPEREVLAAGSTRRPG